MYSCDPGHAHLEVVSFYDLDAVGVRRLCLWQIWSRYLYSFKNYKGGPKITKLGYLTQATPTYGSFYGPDAVGVRRLCLCQIWTGYLFIQKL